MENNNHKNLGKTILICVSIVLVLIGGCGLDSESIVMPSMLILSGLVCGMIAAFSDTGDNL